MTREELLVYHLHVCNEARQIMKAKNQDYADGDAPFRNFEISSQFGVAPPLGILLRMSDKMQRLRSYIHRGELAVKDEGFKDAVLDIVNYAILVGAMLAEEAESA